MDGIRKQTHNMRRILQLFVVLLPYMAMAQTQTVFVLDYMPAPGQFVNTLPAADDEMTQEEVNQACEEQLNNDYLVHLGTYGGSITMKFDHQIENKPGSDFYIKGNGFYADSDPSGATIFGGSIEPGIVYVGVGDDWRTAKWYELAGSEYYTSEIHDFKITYHKPTAEKGSANQPFSSYDNYIRWECSWTDKNGLKHDSVGYHMKNTYHRQSYWPAWNKNETMTCQGGKLPNNAIEQSGNGTYWVQYQYSNDAYGYVDACASSDSLHSSFDIDWAVDEKGNHVALDHIDFIRVVCGIFQYCGWLGETSTELACVKDLHLIPGYDDNPYKIIPRSNPDNPTNVNIPYMISDESNNAYYNLTGQRVNVLQRGEIYIHKGKKIIYK